MTSVKKFVKIGLPAEQAQSIKGLRHIRQILEQHDAAIARLTTATNARIREAVSADNGDADDVPVVASATTEGASSVEQSATH